MSSQVERSCWSGNALEWLWKTCFWPILSEVQDRGILSSEEPRIWWSGSGIASSFPFHAAAESITGHGALDCVASSNTPTIKALGHSRSRASANLSGDRSVLVVTMPNTPGQVPLPGAVRESSEVQSACQTASTHYSFHKLICPTAAEVMERLHTSDILHFAGTVYPIRSTPREVVCHYRRQEVERNSKIFLVQPKKAKAV
jgi:hypothetical protein